MFTLGEMSKALNRPAVYLAGCKPVEISRLSREPPIRMPSRFLRSVVFMRMLGASEAALLTLWHLEKKLLTLLHADSLVHPLEFSILWPQQQLHYRLLLTNFEIGFQLKSQAVQLGMNFTG